MGDSLFVQRQQDRWQRLEAIGIPRGESVVFGESERDRLLRCARNHDAWAWLYEQAHEKTRAEKCRAWAVALRDEARILERSLEPRRHEETVPLEGT